MQTLVNIMFRERKLSFLFLNLVFLSQSLTFYLELPGRMPKIPFPALELLTKRLFIYKWSSILVSLDLRRPGVCPRLRGSASKGKVSRIPWFGSLSDGPWQISHLVSLDGGLTLLAWALGIGSVWWASGHPPSVLDWKCSLMFIWTSISRFF